MSTTIMRATTTFHGPDHLTVMEGALLDDNDPAVKKFPRFFAPADQHVVRSIETVVAKPGQRSR